MKKKKIKQWNNLLFAAGVLALCATIFATWHVSRLDPSPVDQPKIEEISPEDKYSQEDRLAIEEARAVADSYFAAAKECDLDRAQSYRLLPSNDEQSPEKCRQQCPGGIVYEFAKTNNYAKEPVEGEVTEYAFLEYWISCDGKTHPAMVQMMRSPEADNIWQIINATAFTGFN